MWYNYFLEIKYLKFIFLCIRYVFNYFIWLNSHTALAEKFHFQTHFIQFSFRKLVKAKQTFNYLL